VASIERFLQRLSAAMLFIGALVILLMTFHVTADVLFKVGLNKPIVGTLEFVTYLYMVACIFLPLPHVQADRSLIAVELFTQKMSAANIGRLDALGALLTAVYLGLIAWWGGVQALGKTRIGETVDATYFEFPIWPMRWVLVFCCAVAAVIALLQVFDRRWRAPEEAAADRRLGELEI
jgi:TRAP-type C4-dicarboxylate transport system permease small subunit